MTEKTTAAPEVLKVNPIVGQLESLAEARGVTLAKAVVLVDMWINAAAEGSGEFGCMNLAGALLDPETDWTKDGGFTDRSLEIVEDIRKGASEQLSLSDDMPVVERDKEIANNHNLWSKNELTSYERGESKSVSESLRLRDGLLEVAWRKSKGDELKFKELYKTYALAAKKRKLPVSDLVAPEEAWDMMKSIRENEGAVVGDGGLVTEEVGEVKLATDFEEIGELVESDEPETVAGVATEIHLAGREPVMILEGLSIENDQKKDALMSLVRARLLNRANFGAGWWSLGGTIAKEKKWRNGVMRKMNHLYTKSDEKLRENKAEHDWFKDHDRDITASDELVKLFKIAHRRLPGKKRQQARDVVEAMVVVASINYGSSLSDWGNAFLAFDKAKLLDLPENVSVLSVTDYAQYLSNNKESLEGKVRDILRKTLKIEAGDGENNILGLLLPNQIKGVDSYLVASWGEGWQKYTNFRRNEAVDAEKEILDAESDDESDNLDKRQLSSEDRQALKDLLDNEPLPSDDELVLPVSEVLDADDGWLGKLFGDSTSNLVDTPETASGRNPLQVEDEEIW